MNRLFKNFISIMIMSSMCLTGTVSMAFAEETTGNSATASAEPVKDTITVSIKYTNKEHATNTKKLGEIVQKDNKLTVSWSVEHPNNYSKFKIYRITKKGEFYHIKNVDATSKHKYETSFTAHEGTYDYEVRGYYASHSDKFLSADASAPKIASGMLIHTKVEKNLWWSAEAKKKISLYKSPGKKKYTKVTKGTEMKATWEYSPKHFDFWDEPSWVQVKYKGKKLWAKWSQVDMHWHITHEDFPWSTKEKFVNSTCKGKSKTKYLIWVNRYCQRTNVFKKKNGKWRLIKVFDCNTGNYYQPLKGGQYYINGHQMKKEKEHRDGRLYYFMYSTKFGGSGTFHTRCRWSDTNGLRNSIKRHPTTKGCDRLYDEAAKYVYNLPTGTGVLIK